MYETYRIAFNVRNGERIGEMLRDRGLATPGRARNEPNVMVAVTAGRRGDGAGERADGVVVGGRLLQGGCRGQRHGDVWFRDSLTRGGHRVVREHDDRPRRRAEYWRGEEDEGSGCGQASGGAGAPEAFI